ncbi:MAG: 2-alkenal reductase [Verrucomicrobia bacterium]|nr:MAG: 2-alkenal reductase [Verrucomicrobiota bacterium]
MNELVVEDLIKKFEKIGQAHVFKGFEELSKGEQMDFIKRARLIDLDNLDNLLERARSYEVQEIDFRNLKPVSSIVKHAIRDNEEVYRNVITKGEEVISQGKVGCLLVAGGDGTRLGFSGPKGMLPVTAIKKKSLFQLFAEQILVAQRRYGTIIPWFIMTSESNHECTQKFFLDNDYFGLKEVYFFKQGVCPVLNLDKKLILDENGLIAVAPDGHGGCFTALAKNGLIEVMEKLEINLISYFQVDNPLVKCIDPLFIGLHVLSDAEMSCKGVKKRHMMERVGIFCQEKEKVKIVEYHQACEEMLESRDENGELQFNLGNVGVHLMSREFIRKISSSDKLCYYQTKKKVSFLDENKKLVVPEEPNGLKFEKLIFDALGEAREVMLLEVMREDEFSPIKNAEGSDSLESFKKDQLRQYREWFSQVGVEILSEGGPGGIFNIEISPFFADNQDAFIEKWESLLLKPKILAKTFLE